MVPSGVMPSLSPLEHVWLALFRYMSAISICAFSILMFRSSRTQICMFAVGTLGIWLLSDWLIRNWAAKRNYSLVSWEEWNRASVAVRRLWPVSLAVGFLLGFSLAAAIIHHGTAGKTVLVHSLIPGMIGAIVVMVTNRIVSGGREA